MNKEAEANDVRFDRILVVDDTTANLQLLTNLLTEQGYTVYPASDGELALEFVQSTLPDLILLDIRMPGMDGHEVCRRLKADERSRDIPVIFISILDDEHDKVKGFREGAVDYIIKPFQPEEVLARVGIHLRLRELTERLEQKVAERTEELTIANQRLQREVAERRRAEEALQESRQLLDNIVANSPGAIYRCGNDSEFTMQFLSAAITGITGYPADDFLNSRIRTYASIIHPDDRCGVEGAVAAALERKDQYNIDYRLIVADGSQRWVHEQGMGVFSPDGRLLCLDGVIFDITAHRQANEALRLNAEQLTSLTAELSLAEERERHRIATELHDQVGQTLIFSKMKLDSLSRSLSPESFGDQIRLISKCLDQSIQEIRSLTFQLSPPLLYEVGLEAAVEWLGEEFEQKYGLKVEFLDDGSKKPLDEETRVTLYQMVRELLQNVAKHAKAKSVKISVGKVSGKIEVIVADDGPGFDSLHNMWRNNKKDGFGLFNIRKRIEYLGGDLTIESEIGRGTSATLLLPIKNRESDEEIS